MSLWKSLYNKVKRPTEWIEIKLPESFKRKTQEIKDVITNQEEE